MRELVQEGGGGTGGGTGTGGPAGPFLDGAREAEVEAGAGLCTCSSEASWAALASDLRAACRTR